MGILSITMFFFFEGYTSWSTGNNKSQRMAAPRLLPGTRQKIVIGMDAIDLAL
jgi:hypothetical protein